MPTFLVFALFTILLASVSALESEAVIEKLQKGPAKPSEVKAYKDNLVKEEILIDEVLLENLLEKENRESSQEPEVLKGKENKLIKTRELYEAANDEDMLAGILTDKEDEFDNEDLEAQIYRVSNFDDSSQLISSITTHDSKSNAESLIS
ncbi:347_t:CDS:2 [Cetraspora pellucida]|uniref:347_t:CDS:1 n=1 Tax=Cetraspora pellucida TaxID=1433469 RepID=A0ACA9L4A4_9GLOM|nr:347_t:CDS:2 [Cetraspora pellucida]